MNEITPESRFRRLLLRGIAWPVILVLSFALVLFYQTFRSNQATLVAGQKRDLIRSAREIRTSLLDMETSVRGYLLTPSSSFLVPYNANQPLIAPALARLIVKSDADEGQAAAAKVIRKHAQEWLDVAADMISARASGRQVDDKLLHRGKKVFDDLRDAIRIFIDRESDFLSSAEDDAHAGTAMTLVVLVAGSICLAFGLAVSSVTLLRSLSATYHTATVAYEEQVQKALSSEQEVKNLNADLEHRVEERTSELERANKELEAFSYSVSHDLRAPLRSIASFSTILQEDLKGTLDADSLDNLMRIRAAAGKMTELIDALLKFSRIARVEISRSQVNMSEMVQQVFAEFRQRDDGRDIHISVQPGLRAHADPHLVRVVLENLIENAWKFTSKRPGAKIEFGSENGAFFMRDNGVGFEQQYVQKVFLPFERLHTEREFPGTGIGLATTKRIIDRHRGKIWAESKVGEGATFYFTLSPDGDGSAAT